jgi:hypothetical protein
MSKKSFFHKHPVLTTFAAALSPWVVVFYVLFAWDWVRYPCDTPNGLICENPVELCYSPNHEYYIVMTQTPFNAVQDQLYVSGTAKLYDKTGKLLYKGKTGFGETGTPAWRSKPVVYFPSDIGDWWYDLPTSPGDSPYLTSCH